MRRWNYALLTAILLFATAGVPRAMTLAPLLAAPTWLNGRESARTAVGHVVVIDVFTVDCGNCRNVVPLLRELYATEHARGLEIVGIHAPETPIERQRAYVAENLSAQGIVWPVAVDNDFALWSAYGVGAWPTQLFFDRHGRLRKTIVGDAQDDAVRQTVRQLLKER